MNVVYGFIEALVRIIFFIMALYGLWLCVSPILQPEIQQGFRKWKRKRKIRRLQELNYVNKQEKKKNAIHKHLEMLLESVSKNSSSNVFNFVLLTIMIFLVSFTVLITLLQDLMLSLIISLIFSAFPYMIIRFRLTTLRLKTQLAFLTEFHNVIQNYQSTGRDIYYTILNVVKETEDKNLKRIYRKLLSSLQKDRSNREFNNAVTLFSYSINSTFSKRFAKLLIKAHVERVDISHSLLDLNKDIKKRQNDMQTEKTQKLETIIMGYFSVPLFPLMLFCAYKISGLHDFWYYFTQKTSFTIFIIAFVCSVISVLIAFVKSKPRADI